MLKDARLRWVDGKKFAMSRKRPDNKHSLIVTLTVEQKGNKRLPRKPFFGQPCLGLDFTYIELLCRRASLAAVLPLTGQRIATDIRLRDRLQRGLSLCRTLLLLKRRVSRGRNLRVLVVRRHFQLSCLGALSGRLREPRNIAQKSKSEENHRFFRAVGDSSWVDIQGFGTRLGKIIEKALGSWENLGRREEKLGTTRRQTHGRTLAF